MSTAEQNLDMQIDALLKAGVHPDNLHVEKVSAMASRRPKLELALMDARHGDTFCVWKLDRFGRDARDVFNRIHELGQRGVSFRSLMDNFDTTTALGKAFFGLQVIFAQLERDQIVERTVNGLKAARARGYVPGAKRTIDVEQARRMLRKGMTVREVADHFDVTPNAVRRYFTLEELDKLRSGEH